MRTFKGVLSVLLLLVAVSIGEGEKPSPTGLNWSEKHDRKVVGYTLHNGRVYEVIETTQVTYHLRGIKR